MGLQNRKLILHPDHASTPISKTLEKICEHSCDLYSNYTICLSRCSTVCPSICNDDPSYLYPPATSASRSSFHPNKIFIASFSLLALTLAVLFCYAFYYKRFRRSRRPQQQIAQTRDEFLDEDHGPVLDHPIWYINAVGLPAAVIESIAVFKYRKADGVVDGTDCSVCLSEFQEDETLRLLPKCSHAFHISCIDTWLRSRTNCPLCRAPIAATGPADAGESSGTAETRVDIPQEDEAEHGQSPGLENGGAVERRGASLDSSEASKVGRAAVFGSGSSDESNPDPKKVGRSESLLRFVGSSLQRPVFLKRSASCYGEISLRTEESSSGPS